MKLNLEKRHYLVLYSFADRNPRKLDRRIIGVCRGKESAKETLKDLEEEGLVERIGYGRFEVTDRGSKFISGDVACEDCGRRFSSVSSAEGGATMFCDHQNLSYQLGEFGVGNEA